MNKRCENCHKNENPALLSDIGSLNANVRLCNMCFDKINHICQGMTDRQIRATFFK